MDAAVEISELTKVYPNGCRALSGISCEVRKGEIFGLLGVNGAGKSTTIKILTTLMQPTSGYVKVLGRDVVNDAVGIKRRLGVVPQENNLDIRLTVRQNLVFHSRYFGLGKRAYSERIEIWMEFLGITDKRDEEVFHLSGGTRRKVMLAKAFLTDPDMLILDEPTSGLDPQVRMSVWEKIEAFRESGRTVLLSTHHLEEAERLCDRIGVIHNGRLISVGTPEELKGKNAGIEEALHFIYRGDAETQRLPGKGI